MRKYTHLSVTERRRLYIFREMGLSMIEIAKRLSRSRSTLYREWNRNKEVEGYLPNLAQEKSERRHYHKQLNKLRKNPDLHEYVVRGLKRGWSPEQISGRMKLKKLNYSVCPETIYRYIYKSKEERLFYYLHYKRRKRNRRHERKPRNCRYGEIRLITKRPKAIQARDRFGHWEGDTIAFSGDKKKVVITLVERKSRLVYLIKNNNKYSMEIMNKITNKLENLPHKMCKTMTFDQGCEFANPRLLERQIGCRVYYCEIHSPWQKGSNENMNGRIRRYLPSTTNLEALSQENLDDLAHKMNLCPRKCLGFRTPQELFFQQYKNDCRT